MGLRQWFYETETPLDGTKPEENVRLILSGATNPKIKTYKHNNP